MTARSLNNSANIHLTLSRMMLLIDFSVHVVMMAGLAEHLLAAGGQSDV